MYLNKRKKQQYDAPLQKQQQGFVLILVLVLLAVLTLIGVSSMNSANMELRATANAKQHQVAFNVVQSLLEYAVSADGAAFIDFQDTDPVQTQTIDHNHVTVEGGSAYSAGAKFSGCGIGIGNSIEKGFSFNYFDITGTGSNAVGGATGSATSVQVQGIRFPAAAC